MEMDFFDWKFWLMIIILIIVVRWFYFTRRVSFVLPPENVSSGGSDQVNSPVRGNSIPSPVNSEYDLAPIVVSWAPPTPLSEESHFLNENGNLDLEEPIPPEICYVPDLMNNGSASVGEHLTCEAFKELLSGREVVRNIRPAFLTNPKTGYPLEIDCFNYELGVGVEYNGLQHYQYPNVFFKTEREFEAQLERDTLKRQLADLNGTPIFTVPCTIDAVIFNDVQQKYVTTRRTRQSRYDLIYTYLKEQLAPFLISKGISLS